MTQRHTTNLQQPQISSCPSCSLPWACFVTIYIVHIAALVTLLFQTECVLKYCPLGTLRSAQGNKKKPARRGTREVTLLSWLLLPSALPSGPLSPPWATQDSCLSSDQNSLRRQRCSQEAHIGQRKSRSEPRLLASQDWKETSPGLRSLLYKWPFNLCFPAFRNRNFPRPELVGKNWLKSALETGLPPLKSLR